jgi:hypothetical protein
MGLIMSNVSRITDTYKREIHLLQEEPGGVKYFEVIHGVIKFGCKSSENCDTVLTYITFTEMIFGYHEIDALQPRIERACEVTVSLIFKVNGWLCEILSPPTLSLNISSIRIYSCHKYLSFFSLEEVNAKIIKSFQKK